MSGSRVYHFVFNSDNIEALKELLDEIGMDTELYIDAQVLPSYREKEWDDEAGRYKYETSPAELLLELCMPVQTEEGEAWTTYKAVTYQEAKENRATGMVYPPSHMKGGS